VSAEPPRRGLLVWLVASQTIALGSLLPWLAVAGLALLALEAPPASAGPWPALLVGSVLAWPLVPVGCTVGAWLLYARRRGVAAAVVSGLPLVALAVFAGLLVAAGPFPG
jgi:hypothetical protein